MPPKDPLAAAAELEASAKAMFSNRKLNTLNNQYNKEKTTNTNKQTEMNITQQNAKALEHTLSHVKWLSAQRQAVVQRAKAAVAKSTTNECNTTGHKPNKQQT